MLDTYHDSAPDTTPKYTAATDPLGSYTIRPIRDSLSGGVRFDYAHPDGTRILTDHADRESALVLATYLVCTIRKHGARCLVERGSRRVAIGHERGAAGGSSAVVGDSVRLTLRDPDDMATVSMVDVLRHLGPRELPRDPLDDAIATGADGLTQRLLSLASAAVLAAWQIAGVRGWTYADDGRSPIPMPSNTGHLWVALSDPDPGSTHACLHCGNWGNGAPDRCRGRGLFSVSNAISEALERGTRYAADPDGIPMPVKRIARPRG